MTELTADVVRAIIREELERASSPETILTREQVAKLLNVDPHTVTKFVKKKGLPGYAVGREWRFKRSEVLRWMEGEQWART